MRFLVIKFLFIASVFFFINIPHVSAANLGDFYFPDYESAPPGASTGGSNASTCATIPFSYACWNDGAVNSSSCGPGCRTGTTWSKHTFQGGFAWKQDFIFGLSCYPQIYFTSSSGSTGDKCISGETGLRGGSCTPGAYGGIYKYCCSTAGNPVACISSGVVQDPHFPPEGQCPGGYIVNGTTVRSSPCVPIAPPTPTPTPTPSLPNLTTPSSSTVGTFYEGEDVSFRATVQNIGGLSAGGFDTEFRVCPGDNVCGDSNSPIWLGTFSTGSLAVNATNNLTSNTWSNIPPGVHTLRVWADYNRSVPESNELDNGNWRTVCVERKPDSPSGPSPLSGATGVSTNPSLSWTFNSYNNTCFSTSRYRVDFGTNPLSLSEVSSGGAGASTGTYSPGTLANNTTYYWRVVKCNGLNCNFGDVWSFRTAAISPPTPTPTRTPTPTPTPPQCRVTTSPTSLNLNGVGATGIVNASVTSGLGSATINQMRFGSYGTSIATVNPTSDPGSPYSTTVTGIACGATAVWGTADLSDGRTCESTGTTDTDINVSCPTSTPPTPTPTPTPTVSCRVTTSPSVHNLNIGGTGTITATVTGLPGGKTISRMLFGSYDTSIATVNPDSDPGSPYATTVTAVATGATAVWGTAQLNDGDTITCQSTGATDTDVNVSGPSPTPTPPAPTSTTYSITINQATAFCSGTNSLVHLGWRTQGFGTNWFDIAIDGTYVADNGSVGNFWDSGQLTYNQLYRFKVQNHDWSVTGGTPVQSNEVSVTASNCGTTTPTPTPGGPADLIVSSTRINGSLTPSSAISLTGIIRNQGGTAVNTDFGTEFRLSINNSSFVEAGSITIGVEPRTDGGQLPINSGGSTTETSGTWVAELGTHTFRVCTDWINEVEESDDTNNCSFRTFTIATATPTPTPGPPTPTPPPSTYTISGKVYVDANGNGVQDCSGACNNGPGDELNYPGATVSRSPGGSTTTNASGNYSFASLNAGSYTITLTVPVGYTATTPNPVSRTVGPNKTANFGVILAPTPTPTPTPPPSTYTISGKVYVDANGNGVQDCSGACNNGPGDELNRQGATVRRSGSSTPTTTNIAGNYSFSSLPAGSYTITLTVPAGYTATTPNPVSRTVGPNKTVNFGIISGIQCSDGIDNDGDGLIDAADPGCHTDWDPGNPASYDPTLPSESAAAPTPTPTPVVLSGAVVIDSAGDNCASGTTPYTGGAAVTTYNSGGSPTGNDTTDGSGSYFISDSTAPGQKTAVMSNIAGFQVRRVRFDNGAWTTSGLSGYTYGPFNFSANHTLDWCIDNVSPWFQTTTGDVRMNNLINRVPAGKYASEDTSNPSIFYSSNFATEFGSGSSSQEGWAVNDEYTYQDDSKNRNGSMSYSFYVSRIAQQNVTTNNIPGCTGGDCEKKINELETGAYHLTNGNLTIKSYKHEADARVLILVNGDVTIKDKVQVPTGSLLIIAAKGDITIDRTIGTTSPSATTPHINGILTAEGSIILDGTTCESGSPDRRLNVGGALIANSLKPFQVGASGALVNNRSLCLADQSYPSLYVSSRYDFVTQLTDFYKTAYTRWREVAP